GGLCCVLDLNHGGHACWMEAAVIVTSCPSVIDVFDMLMSEPESPTVRPVRCASPPLVLICAAVAVVPTPAAASPVTVSASNVSVHVSPEMDPPPDVRSKIASTCDDADSSSSVPPAK